MMKRFFALILLTFYFSFNAIGQDFDSGLHHIAAEYTIEDAPTKDRYNLKGKVYSLDEKSIYNPGQYESNLDFPFDSLINSYENRPGPFHHKKRYFDEVGREIRYLNISDLRGHEFKYDSLGRLIFILNTESEYNRNTGLGRYGEYFFEKDKIEINWFSESSVYGYSAALNGRKDSLTYSFDNERNIIKIERYKNSTQKPTFIYEYDSLNRIVASRLISNINKMIINSWEFEYDQKGKLTKTEKKNKDGLKILTSTFKRDHFGNPIETIHKDPAKTKVFHIQFEYDSNGNWVKQLHWDGNVLVGIRIRQIEYYRE